MLLSFFQLGLSLLLWLRLVSRALATKGDSGCNQYLCLNATLHDDDDFITYELTSMHQPLGWLALGWGTHMDHTQMVIVWPNDKDGSVVYAQRFGWGHEEPSRLLNPSRHAYPVDPTPSLWSPPNSTRMAFKLTANRTALAIDPIEKLIWAYSMVRPEGDVRATLHGHYRAGRIRVNFTKEVLPPPPPGGQTMTLPTSGGSMEGHHHHGGEVFESENDDGVFNQADADLPWGSHEQLIVVHGVLLAFGLLVLLPSGALIARWTRTITPKWFKAHSIINMTFALPIIVVGWLFGPMAVISHDAPHFVTTHQICGLFMLVLYLLQIWLGRYIHRRRAAGLVKDNKPHPPSNILHVCTGISVITLAFFQVRSGFDEWETATNRGPLHAWCHDLWLAWAIIVPVAYLAGMSLLPRQFFQERQHIMPGGDTNYVVLPDGADSPLLDEGRHDHDVYEISGGEFRNTHLSMDSVKLIADPEK